MSKNKSKIQRPNRDPDHYSDRGVPYWWSPEWVRGTSADIVRSTDDVKEYRRNPLYQDPLQHGFVVNDQGNYVKPCDNYGRIHAVKENNDVNLYMKSKEGNLSFIQGRIQKQFKKWHEDRSIDYLLLGMDPDEIIANED